MNEIQQQQISTSEDSTSALQKSERQLKEKIKRAAFEQKTRKDVFRDTCTCTPLIVRTDVVNPMRTEIVHRKADLRYMYLAYAYLRDVPYAAVENNSSKPVCILCVAQALYGSVATNNDFYRITETIRNWIRS